MSRVPAVKKPLAINKETIKDLRVSTGVQTGNTTYSLQCPFSGKTTWTACCTARSVICINV